MIAPSLTHVTLDLHRVRCSCQTENLVVFAKPWYRFQDTQTVVLACRNCNKSLLPMPVPEGAVTQLFGPETMPLGVAAAVSNELAAEVAEAQDTPAPEIPLDPASWEVEHQASATYTDWLASQPAPAPVDRTRLIENGVATGVLVAIVVLCLFF